MNWWKVLEITYDSDLKTIKKAYAKLLKIYNPEDDAEGYQRLREAYDKAIKYAKKNQKNQEFINNSLDENIIDKVENDKIEDNTYENYSNEQIKFKSNLDINESYLEGKDTKINLHEQIEQFSNRLNQIYNDIYLRTDQAAWEDLLNSDVIWDVNAFPIIEDEIFNFLSKHKYLPAEIWTKLNNNFTWSRNEIKLYRKYSEPIVDEFLKNLKEPNRLKYNYIRSINPEIADEYLYERQQADEALEDKKYAKAYKHLKNANSLFSQDAELLRLMGDYNYELKDIEKALEFYKSAFEINNFDLNSALRVAIILVSYKCFSEAISYLQVYLSYNNNDKLALNHIAYCYYYNDNLTMARENFQKLLCFDKNNKTIKKYLKNIEAQLEGKHVRKIRFNKDNLMVEEIAEKEIKIKKVSNEKSKNMSPIIKYLVKVVIIYIMFYGMRHQFGYKNSGDYNNTKNNKTYEYSNKENKSNKTYEDTNKNNKSHVTENFFKSMKNQKVTMNLSNVKPIKYYKISDKFENRDIFSDNELDEKGLRDRVESQLYIGTTQEELLIFADSKFSNKAINKNGKYELQGIICNIDKEICDKIRKEYASGYQGFDLIDTGFVDASQVADKNSKK